jgi:GxxExxY protein
MSQSPRSMQTIQPAPTRAARMRALGVDVKDDRACSEVLAAAVDVHAALGAWHAAETYQNALALELTARGLSAHRAASLSVVYRGRVVGSLVADLLVDDRILLLVRADAALSDAAKIDALRGLAASGVKVGLAFNFGLPELVFARVC